MKLIKFILLILGLFSILMNYSITKAASGANFGIKIVKSNNMKNVHENFFDIFAKPKSYQSLKIFVFNYSSKDKKYKVKLNNATNNNNLSINYGDSNNELTTDHNLTSLIDNGQTYKNVDIPKYSKRLVTFHIRMPSNYYNGILMGGITVKENNTLASKNGISNDFMYSIAVLLRNTDFNTVPNFKTMYSKIVQDNFENNPYVFTLVENNKNNFINNLTTNIIIKNEHGKIVANHSTKQGSVAPISRFKLITPLKNTLPAGKYKIFGKANDLNNNWSWTNQFEVKNNYLVKNDNPKLIVRTNNEANIHLIFILGSFLTILIILIFFIIKITY